MHGSSLYFRWTFQITLERGSERKDYREKEQFRTTTLIPKRQEKDKESGSRCRNGEKTIIEELLTGKSRQSRQMSSGM